MAEIKTPAGLVVGLIVEQEAPAAPAESDESQPENNE